MEPTPELEITRIAPECCAAQTGGALLFLILTSVRTAWLPRMADLVRSTAARSGSERAAVLSVFRLDKRYPLDVGFDSNLDELRRGHGDFASSIGASSIVLEFSGVLAVTMRAAVATMGLFVKNQYPQQIHSSLVAATSWLLPYVDETQRRNVAHYTSAMESLRMELASAPSLTK